MAGLFSERGNGMDDAGLTSRADAAFGMFEEGAFGDIGDIWAFFSDGLSDWAEEDAFSSFMSDRGLPVEAAPARPAPIQSIADLAVAVRLETERLAALPSAPLPDRRALPVSAPVRRQGKRVSATGGLFDAMPPPATVVAVSAAPTPTVGVGPVFPAASLFVQAKPRGKGARSARTANADPVLPPTPPAPMAAPAVRPPSVIRPSLPPVSTLPPAARKRQAVDKKTKASPVIGPLVSSGGLFDLLSTLGGAATARLPDAQAIAAAIPPSASAPSSPPASGVDPVQAPPNGVPAAAVVPLHLQPAPPAAPPSDSSASALPSTSHADPGDSPQVHAQLSGPDADSDIETFEVALDSEEAGAVLDTPPAAAATRPTVPAAPAPDLASPPPPSVSVPPSAPAPKPGPSPLAGRPMPSRSRAAMVERAPAPYPAGDGDRVDFSQAITPAAKPAAKGWPVKRDPSVPRPARPEAAQDVVAPPPMRTRATPPQAPVASVARPPIAPASDSEIVDFFAEFDGLWDGDES